jgi:hypothetical protein
MKRHIAEIHNGRRVLCPYNCGEHVQRKEHLKKHCEFSKIESTVPIAIVSDRCMYTADRVCKVALRSAMLPFGT